MTAFTKKKISTQKILADILKEKREEKKLDLDKIERYTKINKKYLKALENSDFSELPADIYVKNFLKIYSKILNLDSKEIISQYFFEKDIFQKTRKSNAKKIQRNKYNFLNFNRLVKNSLIILIVIILLSYLGIEIKKIFTPPMLLISSPANNLILKKTTVKVAGQSEKEAEISINGEKVISDSKGYFKKDVNLQNGLNIIEITATKKHSKKNTAYRKVMVKK